MFYPDGLELSLFVIRSTQDSTRVLYSKSCLIRRYFVVLEVLSYLSIFYFRTTCALRVRVALALQSTFVPSYLRTFVLSNTLQFTYCTVVHVLYSTVVRLHCDFSHTHQPEVVSDRARTTRCPGRPAPTFPSTPWTSPWQKVMARSVEDRRARSERTRSRSDARRRERRRICAAASARCTCSSSSCSSSRRCSASRTTSSSSARFPGARTVRSIRRRRCGGRNLRHSTARTTLGRSARSLSCWRVFSLHATSFASSGRADVVPR